MRMMNGTPSIPAYYAALAGLDIIHEAGVNRIRDASKGLTARLLARVDPPSAARIQSRDVKRMVRALEVFFLTGRHPLFMRAA